MPIPLLLVGLGLFGAVGHSYAKETNEKAQKVSQDAQELYESEKYRFEQTRKQTEEILLKLGNAKKNTLDTSMKRFVNSYEKIKHIQFKESYGVNEISKLMIDAQGVNELKVMMDKYSSAIEYYDTTAIVALAAVGNLWSIGGFSSILGTFGGPATLCTTALYESIKADENLEKANAMYAEAEVASEKLKVLETLCGAIFDRADMFLELLIDLNGIFSLCSNSLADILEKKKKGKF